MSLYLGNQKVTPTIYYKDNKTLTQVVDGSVSELTAEDLKGATSIRNYAFRDCTGLTSVTIPDSVTYIGSSAFNGCRSLTSVTIPDSVTYIDASGFSACRGLTSVTYLGTIDQWVEISFMDSTSNPLYNAHNLYINDELVTEVNLTTATKISAYAFYNCSGLTSATIGNGVTSIGNYAFGNCRGLTSITMLSTTPPTIESSTLPSNFSGTITVPAGTGSTYKAATNWSKYADYIVEAEA